MVTYLNRITISLKKNCCQYGFMYRSNWNLEVFFMEKNRKAIEQYFHVVLFVL